MNKVFLIFFTLAPYCYAVSFEDQLNHITISRRALPYDLGGTILGLPSAPRHLPEAEPILPGHTLIRPAFGMLKSAVKFPHRELENGAGVNGNMDNLGLTWDGRNERLEYSGFRRNDNEWSSSDEYRPNLGRSGGSSDDTSSSKSSKEDDDNYTKAPRRSNYGDQEDDYADYRDLDNNVEDYTDAVSKVYKNLIASTLNILQNKNSVRRYNYNQDQESSEDSHEGPHGDTPRIIYSKDIHINKKGVKGREEGWILSPKKLKLKKILTPWNKSQKINTKVKNDVRNKLWKLQMTGDHVNLNQNAPDIHDIVPKKYFANEPDKHWVYLGEMRPKKYRKKTVFPSNTFSQ